MPRYGRSLVEHRPVACAPSARSSPLCFRANFKPAGHTDLEIYVSIVRFGRSLPIRAHPTLNAQLSMRDKAHSELDVGRWALDVGRL